MTISDFFVPNRQTIASISRANPGVVTTTQSHGYSDGAFVRLSFPVTFGMPEVNNQVFKITVLSPMTFSLNQDTSFYQPFSVASTSQVAQVIPVGEIASTLASAVHNNDTIIPEL